MKFNIYGDLCPTKSNIELFRSGEYSKIFGCVSEMNRNADFNIVNLECALGKRTEAIDKSGPCMAAPLECISGLRSVGFNIISVANNHSLDNGIAAFREELGALADAGMQYVGSNLSDIKTPYLITGNDKESVAILSVSDHEYNTDDYGYGVCVFSGHRTYALIKELKQRVSYIVVLYHSGYENALYPSPLLMERCRTMVDYGASAVLCQHSHCVGTYEEYDGKLILYGQGNFLFDLTERRSWHWGLCVSLEINSDGLHYEFEPLTVSGGCIAPLTNGEKESLLKEFFLRSQDIISPEFVKEKWNEILLSETWKYNAMLKGGSRLDYVISKILSMVNPKLRLNKKQVSTYLLFIRSDTHREALLDLLQIERRRK